MTEQVDILIPPLFKPSGQVKDREQAYRDGDWIGTFNLWIVTDSPEPAIIYQRRSPDSSWAPGLLDVAAGGHLQAGEKLTDGLREVEEELGTHYTPDQLQYLGRRLYVGFNTNGTSHNNVVDVYIVKDNTPLDQFVLEQEEVYAICACPVAELLQAHKDPAYTFSVESVLSTGGRERVEVSAASFPENWDDYHKKMAFIASRYFSGEQDILI